MARQALTKKLIEVEGIEELARACALVINRTGAQQIKRALMGAALMLRDEARSNVREMTKKPTGDLESRVFAAYGDKRKPDVVVGVGSKGPGPTNLGHLVEFGTSHSAPVPYMRQAVLTMRPTMARVLSEGLSAVINDAVKAA